MTYGIIFWGNSADRSNVFQLQKKKLFGLLRIPATAPYVANYLKKLDILPLQSQYILSLALFVIKNMEIFSPKLRYSRNK